MPNQPDIETRIGVMVDQHHAEPCGTDGTGLLLCWCGERFHNFADHSMHVAEVLVSELGLTQNTATVRSNAGWLTHPGTKAGDVMVRYVTEWKRA